MKTDDEIRDELFAKGYKVASEWGYPPGSHARGLFGLGFVLLIILDHRLGQLVSAAKMSDQTKRAAGY